jgi:hypothetical protein
MFRQDALEEAQRRIERELALDATPKPEAHKMATVKHQGGKPCLVFTSFSTMPWLTAEEAIKFARWILDTFGEEAAS